MRQCSAVLQNPLRQLVQVQTAIQWRGDRALSRRGSRAYISRGNSIICFACSKVLFFLTFPYIWVLGHTPGLTKPLHDSVSIGYFRLNILIYIQTVLIFAYRHTDNIQHILHCKTGMHIKNFIVITPSLKNLSKRHVYKDPCISALSDILHRVIANKYLFYCTGYRVTNIGLSYIFPVKESLKFIIYIIDIKRYIIYVFLVGIKKHLIYVFL